MHTEHKCPVYNISILLYLIYLFDYIFILYYISLYMS